MARLLQNLHVGSSDLRCNFMQPCIRNLDGPLSDVKIEKGQEDLAEAIIVLAVRHYLASQEPLPIKNCSVLPKCVAELDFNCFSFELFSISAP